MTATVTAPATATTPEQQQIHDQVEAVCRTCGCRTCARPPPTSPAARSQRWDPAETVRVLLQAEADGRARSDADDDEPLNECERAEPKRLKKTLDLKTDRGILRKAAAYVARETMR